MVDKVQTELNHKLETDGYVFLNDVYVALGLKPRRAFKTAGWILSGDESGFKYDIREYVPEKVFYNKCNEWFVYDDPFCLYVGVKKVFDNEGEEYFISNEIPCPTCRRCFI